MSTRTFARPRGRVDYVRNQSERHGNRIRGIVIHTTESHNRDGRSDVDSIHAWFDNPNSGASSHVIIDAEGHSTTCVADSKKAWTCAAYNSQTLNIELVGFAAYDAADWVRYEDGIKKAAKFGAFWSRRFDIPVRDGVCDNRYAQITERGFFTHSDFGSAGGGHTDPGKSFPMTRYLKAVRYYAKNGWVQ